MSAPASRPVHPCVLSLTDGTRGAEFTCWANLTAPPHENSLPNLVTASASTLSVYSVDSGNGILRLEHTFGNIAGSIIFMETLKSPVATECDALLVGFAGYARLAVLSLTDPVDAHTHYILRADCLVDLTSYEETASYGAVPEIDMQMYLQQQSAGLATVLCSLGGGVALVALEISHHRKGTWIVSKEPHAVPLVSLRAGVRLTTQQSAQQQHAQLQQDSLATGIGDILSLTALPGFAVEPIFVILHTAPGGRVAPGRLGRDKESGRVAPPLFVTALSISVPHGRTSVFWSKTVTADALYLQTIGNTLVCVGASTLVFYNSVGTLQQVLAVNGFAHASCPSALAFVLKSNPFLKLSLSLDGSCLTSIADNTALLSLRRGQLYVVQQFSNDDWTLTPVGQKLGRIGEVACLSSLPFGAEKVSGFLNKKMAGKQDAVATDKFRMGLMFGGSRLGDSYLLGYAMEAVVMDAIKYEGNSIKVEVDSSSDLHGQPIDERSCSPGHGSLFDQELSREEDALYAPVNGTTHVIPTDDGGVEENGLLGHKEKRYRPSTVSVLRTLSTLDVLVNPGPLGACCEGPIAKTPEFLIEKVDSLVDDTDALFGAPGYIFPAGFGSSGGLSVVTAPGRDDRCIKAELDCKDVECMFSLRYSSTVLMGMSKHAGGGISILRVTRNSDNKLLELAESDITELQVQEKSTVDFRDVFSSQLLSAGEFANGHFVVVIEGAESNTYRYSVVVFDDKYNLLSQNDLAWKDSELSAVTPSVQVKHDGASIAFACLWSSGEATLTVCSNDGTVETLPIENAASGKQTGDGIEPAEEGTFYSSRAIVAVDVFQAPRGLFVPDHVDGGKTNVPEEDIETQSAKDWKSYTVAQLKNELRKRGMSVSGRKADLVRSLEEQDMLRPTPEKDDPVGDHEVPPGIQDVSDDDFDLEEQILYSAERIGGSDTDRLASIARPLNTIESSFDTMSCVAVCTQSGELSVFELSGNSLDLRWKCHGCGIGSLLLGPNVAVSRNPVSESCVREIRFFLCGSSETERKGGSPTRKMNETFCLMTESSMGDIALYRSKRNKNGPAVFTRIPQKVVGRPSKEQSRHHTKLVRKGISRNDAENEVFRTNRLQPFSGISGQAGLFYAGYRPFWIVGERGMPTFLVHRSRHAAPGGSSARPVRCFCPNVDQGSFLTLHERVGRVGSQKITLFDGLSNIFDTHGLLSGGGLCAEKIFLGVTVRQIHFIEQAGVSSGSHPLYALLISREYEVDERNLNSDGLTDDERAAIEEEKERNKIQKQVEADLSGFDLHTEWVEEIERENCFEVDADLGGAPPRRESVYSLWIVDAADNWSVVDSFEFEQHEKGISMEVVSLTVFKSEPGSSSALDDEADEEKAPFIVVGTGIVDHNGEDVSSRGRVLLFSLSRKRETPGSGIDLSMEYEKDIFHGPVSSISCLSVEGKNRLVIGAGSDVNIEQFGNGKLTQVGFFRATMEIIQIMMFKNFLLLSDAYDSLYFLVWRESDKSLTLLAKDYDPIPVHAAGLMSRGQAMTFLCHDDRQNLQFFQYAPGEAAARGGNRLVCRADCNIGTQTTSISTHFCRSSLLTNSATPDSTLAALKQQDPYHGRTDDDNRLGIFFGNADGGMVGVVPLSEPVFWRLRALQSVMANALNTNCALNQREWRLYRRSYRRSGCRTNNRKKSVIDGDLIMQYANLPLTDQEDLAASIGSSVELVLDNLLEIQCSSLML